MGLLGRHACADKRLANSERNDGWVKAGFYLENFLLFLGGGGGGGGGGGAEHKDFAKGAWRDVYKTDR